MKYGVDIAGRGCYVDKKEYEKNKERFPEAKENISLGISILIVTKEQFAAYINRDKLIFHEWVKRLNQVHYFLGSQPETLCGRPMLGNNYALEHNKPYLVGERKICEECETVKSKKQHGAVEKKVHALFSVKGV